MLIRRLLAVPVLLTVAACSSTASSATPPAATPSSTASASTSASASASAAASGSATEAGKIEAEDSSLGTILVDEAGNTIYWFGDDVKGTSNCSGECIANWPPVVASGTPETSDDVTAKLGTITRDDGTAQLTVNGFPAYYFAGDQEAGDTNGQGLFDKWFVIAPDGKPIKS
jgi:predicted lipoprotein with Yx(FWY)xxD motif